MASITVRVGMNSPDWFLKKTLKQSPRVSDLQSIPVDLYSIIGSDVSESSANYSYKISNDG